MRSGPKKGGIVASHEKGKGSCHTAESQKGGKRLVIDLVRQKESHIVE